ncbi:MAG: hypothetical protein R3346_01975 [Candidatus Spechtbacterales bacterium]|nr:hypothetical protein [Candidatus Spechtbacterales bacterium]
MMDVSSNIVNFIKELVKEFAAEGLVDIARGGNGKVASTVAKVATDRIKKSGEYRHELVSFWRYELKQADSDAAESFIRRHRMREKREKRTYYVGRSKPPYEAGSEQFMINVLGEVYKNLDPNKEKEENREREREARLELFTYMGNLSDKEFDSFLVMLHNDTVRQWITKAWETASHFGKEAYKAAERAVSATLQKIESIIPEPEQVKKAVEATDKTVAGAVRWLNSKADSWLTERGA